MTTKKISLACLTDLIRKLRSPDGCPWDRRQKLGDLRAYVVEEAHELAAAMDAESWDDVAEETGDLLFQLVFVAELATEAGQFELPAVISGIHQKMMDRHPHVFGGQRLDDAREVHRAWEKSKARKAGASRSVLDGVLPTLPALVAAYRLGQKAAGVGFDWDSAPAVTEKLEEELGELRQEMAQAPGEESQKRIEEEMGDLLFAAANLSRKLGVDPEAALARANGKFKHRFKEMEADLAVRHRPVGEASSQEMEDAWERIKKVKTLTAPETPSETAPEARPREQS